MPQAGASARQLAKDQLAAEAAWASAKEAGKLHKNARVNYRIGKATGKLEKAVDDKKLRAAASNSGKNIANSIRQGAAKYAQDPKKYGFTKSEGQMIEKFVKGTIPQNRLRDVANMLGGGGGMASGNAAAWAYLFGQSIGGPKMGAMFSAGVLTGGRLAKGVENTLVKRKAHMLEQKMLKDASRLPKSPATVEPLLNFGTKTVGPGLAGAASEAGAGVGPPAAEFGVRNIPALADRVNPFQFTPPPPVSKKGDFQRNLLNEEFLRRWMMGEGA
jgi:hypothetical protein